MYQYFDGLRCIASMTSFHVNFREPAINNIQLAKMTRDQDHRVFKHIIASDFCKITVLLNLLSFSQVPLFV